MTNSLFADAIALQADINSRNKVTKESKTALDETRYVQMVLFVAGNQEEKIKGGTKKAGQFSAALVESMGVTSRHATTIAAVAFNHKINKMVTTGLAAMPAVKLEEQTDIKLAQMVGDVLAASELTTVNKLKAFIAEPVDMVAKLLEAIAKLEEEDRARFDVEYNGDLYKTVLLQGSTDDE